MDRGVLVVGSINHDAIYNVAHLPKPHETVPASGFTTAPGGKGANQAAACALATDRPVRMLGCVGDDMAAAFCLTYLDGQTVDTSHIVRHDALPTGTACILVNAAGDNLIVVAAGANGGLTPAHISGARDLFADSEIILTQLESPLDAVRSSLMQARELGKLSILNPAPFVEGAGTLVALADVITPNQTEASSLTGVDVQDEAGARLAAQELLDMGAQQVVVTLGQNGSLVATPTAVRYVPAYKIDNVVDTSGAGDVYNGALAGALSDGANLVEAALFASAAAAMSVQKPTASHCAPTRKETLAFQAARRAGQ
jgi:ribokinase